MTIEVEEDCRRLGIFVATSSAEKVKVEQSPEELRREVESIKEEIKGEDLTRNPVVRAYREFYWRIGLDPTKVRPSGEALRRRLINGRDFPFINNVVDSGNLASVRTLVPIGLYDLDKVKGTPRITVSRGGESFHPIGGNVDSLSSGIPIMRDDEKVMHVFPHRDSRLTAISQSTTKLLIVAAGVPNVPRELLLEAIKLTLYYLEKYCGASGKEVVVI